MITVGALGLAPAEEKSISIALKNRAKGIFFVSDVSVANVVLVDVNRLSGPDEWRKYSKHHNSRLISISENENLSRKLERDFVISLRKPLRFSEMLSAIYRALDKQSSSDSVNACKASTAVAHITPTISNKSLSAICRNKDLVDPSNYLLGSALEAMYSPRKNRFSGIYWSGSQWMILDKREKNAFLSVKQKVLRHIAILPKNDLHILHRELNYDEILSLKKDAAYRCSFEELAWILTQYTVRSQQQKGLKQDSYYRLRHWPNLARFSLSDADIPLANLWIESPNSILSISDRCNQSLDKTRAFAACCLNCGLLEEIGDQNLTTNTFDSCNSEPQRRVKEVLTMILRRLAA